MKKPYKYHIQGKRLTVVTFKELKDSFKKAGKSFTKKGSIDSYLEGIGNSVGGFLSVIGDFIQGRHRLDVIDWENREITIYPETAEEKNERWRCKSFDFLDPHLNKIEEKKQNFMKGD